MAKPLYGIDYSALQQPVARVSFRQRGKVFDDDEDYTEQVLHKLKKIKSDEDELIARFLEAVQGGDAALKKPDCPLAKIWYEKALKLIPGEKYPIAQLSRVGDCMNEKARQDQLAAEKAARLREESEKQAVEMQQRQARERDEAEKVAREKEQAALAQEKAVSDAKERAEVEARARAEQEKREMEQAAQEKLAWAKAEEQAKQKAADDKLAREKAETAAREKAARERFLQERAKSEAEQKAAAEKLAREKEESAERERNAAGKLAREKAESEAKRQAAGEKSEKEKREEALRRKAAEEKISGEKKNIGQPEINHGSAPENKQISNEGASGDSETAGSEKPGSDPENPAAYDDRVKKSNAPIITVEKNDGERDQRGGWLRRKKSRHAVRHVIGTSQYEQTIAEADDLFQNKEYDKAKLLYGKALDLKPLDAHATSRLDQIKAIQSGPPE